MYYSDYGRLRNDRIDRRAHQSDRLGLGDRVGFRHERILDPGNFDWRPLGATWTDRPPATVKAVAGAFASPNGMGEGEGEGPWPGRGEFGLFIGEAPMGKTPAV